MSVINNSVTVTAGLICSALTNPPIGSSAVTASIGFTEGDAAQDNYVSVTATSSPGTALHSDLAADGFVMVSVPLFKADGVTAASTVTLYLGTTKLGPVPAGFAVVIPVSSGAIVKGVVASGTQTVGVTAIKTTANA